MALVIYNKPLTLVSIIVSQSSKFPSWMGSNPNANPALLTKMSIFFHASSNSLIAAITAAALLTSKGNSWTLPVCLVSNSSFNLNKRENLRPVRTRSYPFSANNSAVAFPIPDVAPNFCIKFSF